jgi:hypothetical protein
MNTGGATPPTRVVTITVTVLEDSVAAGISGGPHCIAEASVGNA